jgi:hypothetical protein
MLLRAGVGFCDGKPLIQLSLQLAAESHARPHVMTRVEKKSLIQYLHKADVSTQIVTPTREWPETLLQSREFWGEYNVVCLPDSEFAPLAVVDEMYALLESSADIVFATFQPSAGGDFSSWGVLGASSQGYVHCEKPTHIPAGVDVQAWGLFGFRRQFGVPLLQQMLDSTFDHQWRPLLEAGETGAVGTARVSVLSLQRFNDLTR